jgi:hypothetical protein
MKNTNIFNINIEKLQEHIDNKLNIEGTRTNAYIFILMFLQRVQLVSNILKLLDKYSCHKYNFNFALKYNLINLQDYSLIKNKIKDFKKDFTKQDVISEILNFIKSSNIFKKTLGNSTNIDDIMDLDKDLTKPLLSKTRMTSIITDFISIDNLLTKIEKDKYVNEEDFSEYFSTENISSSVYVSSEKKNSNFAKIEKEKMNTFKKWHSFIKDTNHVNYPMYLVLQDLVSLD